MKKHIKKIVTLGIILISCMLICLMIYMDNHRETISDEEYLLYDSYGKYITILNDNFKTDVVLYGDGFNFRERLNVRKIESITPENLKTDADYQYIIISNLNRGFTLSDDEIKILKEAVFNGKANFYYLGIKDFGKLKDNGFTSYDLEPGQMSLSAEHYYGGVYPGYFWTSSDVKQSGDNWENNLGLALTLNFVRVIEEDIKQVPNEQ